VQRFIEWYIRLTYQRCDHVLAPSRYMCDYLHGIGVTQATCQPLGVDIDTFTPERRGRDLCAELNLPRGTRLLVFAGRFSAEKNIPVLTAAFAKLGTPYHLLLIGGGEAAREDNITRIPYCRDNRTLASYFASADAFVHAGTHETFGLVVLEAMACGRPVVAMRAGAIPELVDEKVGALAEPHADASVAAANLAAAVEGLYRRDLAAVGAAARCHVVSNYSWSRALQAIMARYQSAVAARRVPAGAEGLARAETSTQ
jgi:alpha-1,6-mannosyltransferase